MNAIFGESFFTGNEVKGGGAIIQDMIVINAALVDFTTCCQI